MRPGYIIIQAGGRGERMERLTFNKPKALISVDNLPIIFHIFKAFPKSEFLIIGDYKCDVLKKYLETFAEVNYTVIDASSGTGTCAGINKALEFVPDGNEFAIIWSDLVLPEGFKFPEDKESLIGITNEFECRRSFKDGKLTGEKSSEYGVAGIFKFKDKAELSSLPDSGEFVKWLEENGTPLTPFMLKGVREIGTLTAYEALPKPLCRPFNKIEFKANRVIKTPITEQGKDLAQKECGWYKFISDKALPFTPKIYGYNPLVMEKIDGTEPYNFTDRSDEEKKTVLQNILKNIKAVHSLGSIKTDKTSFYETLVKKTFERMNGVKSLIPFAENEHIVINNKKCKNPLYLKDEITREVMRFLPEKFCVIHGDITFSNIIVKKDLTAVFIDPRGYFGKTEIYGDPAYDYAKLYYSAAGNYDNFNRKNFTLKIKEKSVEFEIASSGWEKYAKLITESTQCATEEQLDLYHALIWLSLSAYARDDYDSVCCAFYNGTYLLNETLGGKTQTKKP